MRLNKYLAQYGGYSRREGDRLISAGNVRVNDTLAKLGMDVKLGSDQVFVGDRLIPYVDEKFVYLKFNKPPGVITSYGDELGRANLNNYPELAKGKYPYSGRLDYASCGLIIFSNDGDFIQRVQRPEHKVDKEYFIRTDKEFTNKEMSEFAKGMTVDGEKFLPCDIRPQGRNQYSVILREGKNRQLRKMFESFGVKITFLMRVRIGSVNLDKIGYGSIKPLDKDEILELSRCIGLKK